MLNRFEHGLESPFRTTILQLAAAFERHGLGDSYYIQSAVSLYLQSGYIPSYGIDDIDIRVNCPLEEAWDILWQEQKGNISEVETMRQARVGRLRLVSRFIRFKLNDVQVDMSASMEYDLTEFTGGFELLNFPNDGKWFKEADAITTNGQTIKVASPAMIYIYYGLMGMAYRQGKNDDSKLESISANAQTHDEYARLLNTYFDLKHQGIVDYLIDRAWEKMSES